MLAIEIDGDDHYEKERSKKDKKRTAVLNELGIKVIRYTNLDVMQNIDGVYEDLFEKLKERIRELASFLNSANPPLIRG